MDTNVKSVLFNPFLNVKMHEVGQWQREGEAECQVANLTKAANFVQLPSILGTSVFSLITQQHLYPEFSFEKATNFLNKI